MSSQWGRNIRISLFGESHGAAIGITIDGLPAGYAISEEATAAFMQRRAPGWMPWSTPRRETDSVEIVSGLYKGRTTGSPLCGLIRNTDQRSHDYPDRMNHPRPGHADLTADIRYGGFQDHRGGGHFSGRLTAPLTFAGAVCSQIIQSANIWTASRIVAIAGIEDQPFSGSSPDFKAYRAVAAKEFPVLNDAVGRNMIDVIRDAREAGDSVGGLVEGVIVGLPAGLGDPVFDSVESRLSSLLYGIPAVKGVSFGSGFRSAGMYGSSNNDEMVMENGDVRYLSNHAGGILGGLTTGEPVVFTVAFKPTPSIKRTQKTLDLEKQETIEYSVGGRHDPCIVPRAVPVVEAAAALFALDLLNDRRVVFDERNN